MATHRLSTSLLRRSGLNIARARFPGSHSLRRARVPSSSARDYATTTLPPPNQGSNSPFKVGTVFTALLCIGIGATAYGLYDIYSSMTLWPTELRKDLRAAITAKQQENYRLSERYFDNAWGAAQQLPLDAFGAQPYLKITGIAIALAEVYEIHGLPDKAYEVYSDALALLQKAHTSLKGQERLRAVAIASKLGEMAETYQQSVEEEEKWLVLAVEEVLKIVQGPRLLSSLEGHEAQMLSDLELPKWVSTADIGAPLEALGAYYARRGNIEYAIPLYLQTINLLVPPSRNNASPPDDRCRGAQLMSNLSELIMRKPTPENISQAELWAKQGLAVLQKTKESVKEPIEICEHALAVAYINLATLQEMSGNRAASRELFVAGFKQSQAIGLKDGMVEAKMALRRLDRLDRTAPRSNGLPVEPEIPKV